MRLFVLINNIELDTQLYYVGVSLSLFIFIIGLIGILWNRHNFILMLINLELAFFGVICFIIFVSSLLSNFNGFILALFAISIAASETVIGLSLLIRFYRLGGRSSPEILTSLRG